MAENQDKCGETKKKKTKQNQKTATNPGIIHIRIGVLNTCDYHLH